MGGCRCSYKTCKSATKTHQELHFFHYPVKTRERCMEWIQNADRVEFSYLPNDQLRNKVICGLHFRDSCFTNELRKRLVHDAVPTLDVGCDPEEEAVQADDNPDYLDLQQEFDAEESGDSSSMNATAYMGDGCVATIKASGGDGCTFSLDTDPYVELQQKPHLITYNFVNGSLVPTIASEEAASSAATSNRNGNVQAAATVQPQPQYDAYNSIFVGDPSNSQLQYITAGDCTVATVQSTTIRSRFNQGSGLGNHSASSTALTVNRADEGMDSYMLAYVQDPLADDDGDDGVDNKNYDNESIASTNNRRGRHAITTFNIRRTSCDDDDQSGGECVIQLETHTNDEDINAVHILPGNHNFVDAIDDGDGDGMMVSAEEIIPDNTHRPKSEHHHVPVVIDICGDDETVIVGGGSLFGGDVDMDLLPPLHAPIVHMSPRNQPPSQQPPLLLHRAIVPGAKQHRTNNNNKKNKAVHIQQTDIARPQLATTSTQIRHLGEPPQPQRTPGKKTYTFVTTASIPAVKSSLLKPTTLRISTATPPTVTPALNNQRTTTFIKSTMPSLSNPHPKPQILRTEIQQIIQGGGVTKSNQSNTSAVCANKATVSHTVVSGALGVNTTSPPVATMTHSTPISSGTRKREASASLAALRTELPPSMYSAIAIHLQRKRAFFDTAETEFLTTLYTSTPKGYTTLRNKLGWELPDEETVKELLELREN